MKIKRILSIFLILALSFGMCTIAFAEENTEISEDDVDMILPPCEDVEVSVVYRPLKSMISFAGFGPMYEGTVLKITYTDGRTEVVILENNWTGLSDYVAGDYYVNVDLFNTMEVKSPGINRKSIYIGKTVNGVQYEGLCRDFTYLYIPSLGEWMFMISNIFKSVFNPIIDFGV